MTTTCVTIQQKMKQLIADDIALFSCSRVGLQVQLDYLAELCKPRGLEFNVNKTRVIVFKRHESHTPVLQCCQLDVQQNGFFEYLGIVFHASKVLSLILANKHFFIAGQEYQEAMFGV